MPDSDLIYEEDPMNKIRRITALIGVMMLLAMYIITFISALYTSPAAQSLFRASLGCTILIPVICYAFLMAVKMIAPGKSPVIDVIIFDVGNVLCDFPWVSYAENMDISSEAKAFILENVIDHPLYAECDLGIKQFETLVEEFCAIGPQYAGEIREFIENMYTCVTPFPYTESWLKDLKGKGYRLYILSNWSLHAYEKLKNNGVFAFEKYMDGATWSFREHCRKPDREIFERLLTDYRIDRSRAVFIDDSPANTETAAKLGIRSILFTDIEDTKSRLKDLGVR